MEKSKKKSHSPDFITIGELSRLTGLSQRVIHLHEQRGFISSVRKGKLGNRYFNKKNIEVLQKVKQLQAIGLSLEEVGNVLPLYINAKDGGIKGKQASLKILYSHLKEAEEKKEQIEEFRLEIKRSIVYVEQLLAQVQKK